MNCIALAQGPVVKVTTNVQRRATDPEIAVLQLSEEEHKALHAAPKDFVNHNHVFDKDVNTMMLPSHVMQAATAETATVAWLVLVRHRPDSSAAGSCVPV